jgi:hypothetical protein
VVNICANLFIDGQAIAKRIEKGIKKHTKTIRCCIKERDNVCKTLYELGDTTEYITYTFHDVVSSLLFEQRGISETNDEDTVALATQSFRQQIIVCYHLKERCSEEIGLLENEMKNVVEFYLNDIKILQGVESDLFSVGDIAVVRQEAERQKICLGVLVSHFQQFSDVQELIDDELRISYSITDNSTSYGSDSDNVEENDSDDDMVSAF